MADEGAAHSPSDLRSGADGWDESLARPISPSASNPTHQGRCSLSATWRHVDVRWAPTVAIAPISALAEWVANLN